MFAENNTDILRNMTGMAIELNTKFFGIECKIYFPKNKNPQSFKMDDLEFSHEPDLVEKLLIPEIYELRRTPIGGMNDNLFQEVYKLYAKAEFNLPYYSKIVALSEKLGPIQFLVEDSDSITTFTDSIYREYSLSPFLTFNTKDAYQNEVVNNLTQEVKQDVIDRDYSNDFSIAKNDVIEPEEVKFKFKKME